MTDAGSTSNPAVVDALPENLALFEAQKLYEDGMRREALLFVQSLSEMTDAQKLASADKIEKRDKIARKALKLETDKPRSLLNLTLLASGTVERVRIDSDTPANEPLHLVKDTGSTPATVPTADQ